MQAPVVFDPLKHRDLIPQLAKIHADCITYDKTLATFLPPLDMQSMRSWWNQQVVEVTNGSRIIVMQLILDHHTTSQVANNGPTGEGQQAEAQGQARAKVAGYAMLEMPWSQTGPFRGLVQKLLVSPGYRQRGVARRVMEKLEDVAREKRRTLLMLDTTIGTPAEFVYPKLGYTKLGVIPRYGISPDDGKTLVDEIFFYKDLR